MGDRRIRKSSTTVKKDAPIRVPAYSGIYYRESPVRMFAPKGTTRPRPERCYMIQFKKAGKTIKETVGWESDVDFDEVVVKRLAELRAGAETKSQSKKVIAASATVNEYWDNVFMPFCRGDPKQQSYFHHKPGRWEKYFRNDPIGSIKLIVLTDADVSAFWQRLLKDSRCPAQATKIQIFGILQSMIEYAIRRKVYPCANPCRTVSLEEVEKVGDTNRSEAWWKPEAALDILREILNPPNGRCKLRTGDERELFDATLLTLWTGLRANETLQLRVIHWDASTKAITLLARRGRRSKNSITHYIRVPDEMASIMDARCEGKERGALLFPSFWKDAPSDDPETLRKQVKNAVTALGQRFGYILNRLGINEGITDDALISSWHNTRHTAITWKMILSGGDVPTTQRFARHAKVEMTIRYTHYLEQDLTAIRKGLATFWKNLNQIINPRPCKIVSIA